MEIPVSEVYFGDCMEYMKTIPYKYFELAMVDPNYGIGASKPGEKPSTIKQKNGNYLKVKNPIYTHKDWDNTSATKEYFDECIRVSKNQIIWGVNYYDYDFGKGRLVWDKINGNSDQMDCEIAYCSYNDRTDLIYFMWAGMMQGIYCGKDIRKAIIQQGNKALNEERIHPTQKPVALYKYLIENYASKDDKILDTHLGSQSSRIASYDLGFDFYGCELDEEYFKSGCERFEQQRRKREEVKEFGYAKTELSKINPLLFENG